MTEPEREAALVAVEEALSIVRSSPELEGAAKEGVEVLLEIAVEKLRPCG